MYSGVGIVMYLYEANLKDEFYVSLDKAITASAFWNYENGVDDADYNVVFGENVDQTPAAEVLGTALTDYFSEVGYPIVFLVRSPDTSDNSAFLVGKSHRSYPNEVVLGGEMGLSSHGRLMMYLNMAIFDEDFVIADITPSAVAAKVGSIIRHELIHALQYDKRKKSQKISRAMAKKFFEEEGEIVADASDRKKYLSSNIEIDAYAHEFAEILLRNYGKERAINILRTANKVDDLPIPDQLQEYFDGVVSEKQFKKLVGKVYSNIVDLSQRGIVESVIRRLLMLSENAKQV